VIVKEKIIMTGTDSTDRHVTGLSYPLLFSNAANGGSVLNGQLIYSEASGSNLLAINLSPAPAQYYQGMLVNFQVSSPNTAAVQVQLNGLPPVPLKKNGSDDLDSFDLFTGQIITALFDGSNFQILNKLHKRCPAGFVDVNKDYCIELVERDSMNWFFATKTCGNLNSRLCTQSEWAFACQNSSILNLVNMIDNMEWVDSAANSANQCKTMGINAVGVSGCNSGHTQPYNYNKSFRCCFSK
jgi:hypothetical protein